MTAHVTAHDAPRQVEESGTFFVLPPHHRLFAVFNDPAAGNEVVEELRAQGAADDVWTFYGHKGIESLDSRVGRHGVPVGIVRVVQRALTNDCEYCDGLSEALRHGAMVIAVRIGEDDVEALSERLGRRGAHSFAYGAHLNFVPVDYAGHVVGYFSTDEEEDGAPGAGAAADARTGADGAREEHEDRSPAA